MGTIISNGTTNVMIGDVDWNTGENANYIQVSSKYGQPVTDPDCDGVILMKQPDSTYWNRSYTGEINVKWFGAVGDGIADDTLAIQEAIDYGVRFGGRVVFDGIFKVTKQGSVPNGWVTSSYWGGDTYYCLIIGNSSKGICLEFVGDSKFIYEESILSDRASMILVNNSSNVEITGMGAEGFDLTIGRHLFNGAAVFVNESENILIDKLRCSNMYGGVLGTRSERITVQNSLVEKSREKAFSPGAHIGLYACKFCTINNNQTFVGTDDGDIVVYGTESDSNLITGNYVFNYRRGDPDKVVDYTGAQGICSDAGATRTVITGNYAWGYIYGIDVKTASAQNIVSNNILHKCVVGIASRRGEADQPNPLVTISNNQIVCDGGNGRSLAGWITNAPIGILLDDTLGAIVTGNTVSNTYNNTSTPAVTNFRGIQIQPVRASLNASYRCPTIIANNSFVAEWGLGGNFERSNSRFIFVNGNSASLISNIIIDGNAFKSYSGSYANENSIEIQYAINVSIKNNIFSDNIGDYLIRVTNSYRISVNDNVFALNAGLLYSDNNTTVQFNNNLFDANRSISNPGIGVTRAFLWLNDTKYITLNGNIKHGDRNEAEGVFFSMYGNSDFLVCIGNNLHYSSSYGINFTNWYQLVGTNSLIRDNLLNGADVQGLTLLKRASLPTTGTFSIADKIQSTAPVAGGYEGWICVSSGTLGSLTGITGSTSGGSAEASLNDASGLKVGEYISINGVSGTWQITKITGNTITLNANVSTTLSNADIQYVNPVFKRYGQIEA